MRVLFLLLTFTTCITFFGNASDATTYSDSTFQMTDWPKISYDCISDSGGGSASFTQVLDSGTTTPCGRLTGSASAYPSSRTSGWAHAYAMWALSGAEYNPASAPITSIEWGAACRTTSYTHTGGGYGSVKWCLAVFQGGMAYRSALYGPDNTIWANIEQTVPCSASDFSHVFNDSLHPNFSDTGAPLKFGIMVISYATGGDPWYDPNPSHYVSRTIEVDNWWVSINSVPEPSSFFTLLAGAGMSGVLWRRRR